METHSVLEIPDNNRKFLTYMERLRRDVLRKRGMVAPDNQTANVQQLLNVAITSDFKFIHLVGLLFVLDDMVTSFLCVYILILRML